MYASNRRTRQVDGSEFIILNPYHSFLTLTFVVHLAETVMASLHTAIIFVYQIGAYF